jgi:hypothetical protein
MERQIERPIPILLASGVEGVENAFEMFRINPRPQIAHRDQDLIASTAFRIKFKTTCCS